MSTTDIILCECGWQGSPIECLYESAGGSYGCPRCWALLATEGRWLAKHTEEIQKAIGEGEQG